MSGLFIKRGLVIPEAELEESFVRASGPGGQNVNKVASAVKLRFDVRNSPSLPEPVKARLLALADSRLDGAGAITITARRFREQARNRADARARLTDLLLAATRPPKPRLATKPSRASKARRTDSKTRRGRIKKERRRPAFD
ncbi:MAG TPA: alternative ribosome rescue aminoacyl-tRNA hydrolase ArfB [Rhizomicrobium sp.]|nr:alternative ribosome rescue aminoacyl-tRNA hydrolase ArfB [Rhizomicrobium sp.]